MTKETLAALDAASYVPEVADFLSKLKDSGYRVNALDWHYFKYKYEYGDDLPSINTLNERFERVLNDPSAKVLKRGERLKVFSETENRLAIIDGEGRRISVYRPDETITPDWEDAIWQIKDLKD